MTKPKGPTLAEVGEAMRATARLLQGLGTDVRATRENTAQTETRLDQMVRDRQQGYARSVRFWATDHNGVPVISGWQVGMEPAPSSPYAPHQSMKFNIPPLNVTRSEQVRIGRTWYGRPRYKTVEVRVPDPLRGWRFWVEVQ